jgi:CheY-like chemotaxis protein
MGQRIRALSWSEHALGPVSSWPRCAIHCRRRLGLAISRMVVEMHEGTIRAASAGSGKGASFVIDRPLPAGVAEPARTVVPEAVTSVTAENGGGRRILLVEDHAATRLALERLLVRRKFAVSSAGSLAEALALARHHTFDLLISDLGLPDGSGCDLMRECARDRGLKGIALTGYGMEADVARCRAAGFAAHLTKPISVHALDRAIADVLRP